jgi:hypothetical protein
MMQLNASSGISMASLTAVGASGRPGRPRSETVDSPAMKRLFAAALVVLTSLVLAVPAFAHDNGEGLVGETNDKDITFFSLGVVVFFAVFVIVMSALQGALEKRKEARKATDLRQRIGW